MRNVPGRKTDKNDAQWIANLLRHGLLTGSFIPLEKIRTLREFCRLYRTTTQDRARVISQIEKHLQMHGFKLSSVLSDITNVSGRGVLDHLCAQGRISVVRVGELLNYRVKRSREEVAAAVDGILGTEPRKILRILLQRLDFLAGQLQEIQQGALECVQPVMAAVQVLDTIPGIDITAALEIIAEIGTDMTAFPSSAHLCSWAGLSPRNNESAGKKKSTRIMSGNPYVKSILCQVAWAAVRTRKSRFHAWYWSHKGTLGTKKALIAVSRKLLSIIYRLLTDGAVYDTSIDQSLVQVGTG